jgi:tRNA nucleotidyltransferase (CCA-adding enzyme)
MIPMIRPPKDVLHICQVLYEKGYEAWLVGGAVRDALLDREAHDWDIATDAKPEKVASLFRKVIETGIQHGTVTVMLNGQGYEVTTYRGDGEYSDGRRPDEVTFVKTIEEDLARRDFTANAIAYDPIQDLFTDPFGGQDDIDQKLIKAVGDPLKRFSEDGLRVLRAARFAATLGFKIGIETYEAIQPSLGTLAKVSVERVRDEWLKAMLAPKPSAAFDVMLSTYMLESLAPELMPMVGCQQNKYHAFDVWQHTMVVVDACPANDPILRMAALLHDIGKPKSKGANPDTGDATFYDHEIIGEDMTRDFLSRMRFSVRERERVTHLVRHHFVRYESDWTDTAVRRWVRKVLPEHVADLCTLARADIVGKGPSESKLDTKSIDELEQRIKALNEAATMVTSTKLLAINGSDVMARLGIGPGQTVGKVLNALLEKVTDDPEINNREALLGLVDTIGRSQP